MFNQLSNQNLTAPFLTENQFQKYRQNFSRALDAFVPQTVHIPKYKHKQPRYHDARYVNQDCNPHTFGELLYNVSILLS